MALILEEKFAGHNDIEQFVQDGENRSALNSLGLDYIASEQGLLLYSVSRINAILQRSDVLAYLNDIFQKQWEIVPYLGKLAENNLNTKELTVVVSEMLKYNIHLIGIMLGYRLEDVKA